MSVFAYDPNNAKVWANKVTDYINGGTDSIGAISKKFGEQLEALVQPNVWTGDAAYQNYINFLDTHRALIKFANDFGGAFQETMTTVNRSVAQLETTNLGANTNVTSAFGTLTFDQITELSEQNIVKELVRYDYAAITGIGAKLKEILGSLETLNTGLESAIKELNCDSPVIWTGDAAENAKNVLSDTLKSNMAKVLECLNVCISNISKAAEAASVADKGM